MVQPPLVGHAERRISGGERVEEVPDDRAGAGGGEHCGINFGGSRHAFPELRRSRAERYDTRHRDVEAVALGGDGEERETTESLLGR